MRDEGCGAVVKPVLGGGQRFKIDLFREAVRGEDLVKELKDSR